LGDSAQCETFEIIETWGASDQNTHQQKKFDISVRWDFAVKFKGL